jgi:bifunctional DNase/RNase
MLMELIQLSFDKIVQTRSYTMVVLGAQDKRFAIYTDPAVGRLLQTYLMGAERPRPLTHDLIDVILKGLDVRIKQVVINDFKDTVYFARLFLEQYVGSIRHIVEIDARPSDCITLALMDNVPLYCTRDVLERTLPVED